MQKLDPCVDRLMDPAGLELVPCNIVFSCCLIISKCVELISDLSDLSLSVQKFVIMLYFRPEGGVRFLASTKKLLALGTDLCEGERVIVGGRCPRQSRSRSVIRLLNESGLPVV